MSLLALDDVSVAYGHLPLLDHAVLQIDEGERVAVVGRNGAGKSTLLRLVSGELAPDSGLVTRTPGLRVARLDQDVPSPVASTVFDVVAGGLGEISDLVAQYHHVAVQLAEAPMPSLLDRLGRLQHDLEERNGWRLEQRVETVLASLGLPADARVESLSGGWRRRTLLARALVAEPGLLLLDEPTNHLDLQAILWLESFLVDYPGTVVFVTHDRAFLQRVATRIVEVDRGRVSSWPGDYDTYVRRKQEWLDNEATRKEKFDRKLAEEEVWLRQGIKARRTRNEGRVRALMAMREERAQRREVAGSVRLQFEQGAGSGQTVFELRHVTKAYGGRPIVLDFTTRVVRGDRIGLIGPNGSGKTTLLRLVLGELAPDGGEVERGTNVQVAYYDQERERLDPERTVFDTIGEGNDTVTVNGRTRHVNAYLRDFLFPPERALSPVRSLSGGERNRLLLARLLTKPANVLVLDEPTNDLDLDTLELLEAQLADWPGTLLLVSHDRRFLDNAVTSTWVLEGGGHVGEYVGGYEDWVRQRPAPPAPPEKGKDGEKTGAADVRVNPPAARTSAPRKRSYKEQRELDELPGKIEALEQEQRDLRARSEAPEFYREPAADIARALARIDEIDRELANLYERWNELDEIN